MSHQYEIEIKSLLGSKEKADELRRKLFKKDPGLMLVAEEKQLNHYFNTPTSLLPLRTRIEPLLPEEKRDAFAHILEEGRNVSIRTRASRDTVLFVMKASIGDGTSANAVSRIEFEAEIRGKTLNEVDALLIEAGLSYQAKWSREREEYKSKNTHITIDKNAGYGYLAEFEQVLSDREKADEVKQELLTLMNELGVSELPQDRLERMFSHYNKHWFEYYGTDNIFVVE